MSSSSRQGLAAYLISMVETGMLYKYQCCNLRWYTAMQRPDKEPGMAMLITLRLETSIIEMQVGHY